MNWVEDRLGKNKSIRLTCGNFNEIPLPGGSDAPIENPELPEGIADIYTRQDRKGFPKGGWNPEQRNA